jgi:hypothetical protein
MMASVNVTTSGADIAVLNTMDSVTIDALSALAHLIPTVKVVYAMHTETNMEPALVMQIGATKTVAFMPDNATQDVKTDVSDQLTLTVKIVSSILIEMIATYVYVTLTGQDQTVATTWVNVMNHVTDVMDHHPTASIHSM